jgi:hypothetical protein
VTVHIGEALETVMLRTELIARHGIDPAILAEVIASGAMRAFTVDGNEYVDAAPLLKYMRNLVDQAREHAARAGETTPRESTDRGTVTTEAQEERPAGGNQGPFVSAQLSAQTGVMHPAEP